jgi:hypothetical protein
MYYFFVSKNSGCFLPLYKRYTMRFIFVFLLGILFFSVQAQRFGGGILAGVVGSQLDGDRRAGYDKMGFVAGGFVDTKLNQHYGLQMEIKFIQKGSKGKDTLGGSFNYYESRMNYIEMPVFINYLYKEKYRFELGLSVGYLINAFEDKDGIGLVKASPDFNKFEVAATAGVTYMITEQFFITSRFTYSALPVRPYYAGAINYMDRGQYNNVLSLALFYKFKKTS